MTEQYRPVRRIVAILKLMAANSEGLRLTDINASLGIPVSSCHLLLQELVREGMIQRIGDRIYAPGEGLVSLGVQMTKGMRILEAARPFMVNLMEQTEQDVYLAVPSGPGMMYIDRVKGPRRVRVEIPLGVRRPLHATAVGQLYLASLDPSAASRLIDSIDLDVYTPHTITDRAALRTRIELIRRTGVAISNQGSVDGILGLASSVFGYEHCLIGALSLSLFCSVGAEREDEFAEMLKSACAALSRSMGWRPRASENFEHAAPIL